MTKEEIINLIAGRIIDESRKHPNLEWHKIAAAKIYTQWTEFFKEEEENPKCKCGQNSMPYKAQVEMDKCSRCGNYC